MQEFNSNDIRRVAMNFLASREYLRSELALKLLKSFRKADTGEGANIERHIEQALDQLAAENLQSDQRYVESYIRSRSNRGYGPDRIRMELRQKGVDAQVLDGALDAQDVDWVSLAREVRAKKFGGKPPVEFRDKAKQLRFLNYRGFGSEFASAAVEADDQDY